MSPYILILVGSESDPTSQRVVDEEGGEYYLRSGSGIGPIHGEVVTSLHIAVIVLIVPSLFSLP